MNDSPNNFQPLTPVQEAAIKRDAISESVFSPLDLIGGFGALMTKAARAPMGGVGWAHVRNSPVGQRIASDTGTHSQKMRAYDEAYGALNEAGKKDYLKSLGLGDYLMHMLRVPKLPSALQPGHLALQAGNVAANDWLWNVGLTPLTWDNEDALMNRPKATTQGAFGGGSGGPTPAPPTGGAGAFLSSPRGNP